MAIMESMFRDSQFDHPSLAWSSHALLGRSLGAVALRGTGGRDVAFGAPDVLRASLNRSSLSMVSSTNSSTPPSCSTEARGQLLRQDSKPGAKKTRIPARNRVAQKKSGCRCPLIFRVNSEERWICTHNVHVVHHNGDVAVLVHAWPLRERETMLGYYVVVMFRHSSRQRATRSFVQQCRPTRQRPRIT